LLSSTDRIVLNPLKGALVATLQGSLTTDVLQAFQADLLHRLSHDQIHHLILDFSGMEMMDPDEFADVRKIAEMGKLMGVEPIAVGLRPEVVYALVQLGVETLGLRAALNVEDAFDRLQKTNKNAG
jgi:rsbT antagonist protein RsbS